MGNRSEDKSSSKATRRGASGTQPSRKELKKGGQNKDESAWCKKIAGIVALFLLCGAGAAQFLFTVFDAVRGSGVTQIEVTDTAKLKSVLFSGEPWLVYCVNNETQSHRLPAVFESSARSLYSGLGVQSGILDCWEKTESGRNVAERFKLNNLKPPLTFVVANGNKPRILNWAGVSNYEQLENKIKPALSLSTHKIDTLKKWPSLCTSRKSCIVIGHKNTAQRDYAVSLIGPLLEKYRLAKFVTLDTAFWQLKLNEAVLATRSTESAGKRAEVLCLSRSQGSSDNATHLASFVKDLEVGAIEDLVNACNEQRGLVKLDVKPVIKARPSKPKKVVPPSPLPKPKQAQKKKSVDHVGSRENMDSEDPLVEDVEDDDFEDGADEGEDSDDEEGANVDEVEL